jgi:nucleoid-associated protein YgaU
MRKDVKLGFAIGGILLAVLIVYVLVVPGGKDQRLTSASDQATAAKSRNDAGVKLEPVNPPPAVAPATQPVPGNNVAAGDPPAAPPVTVTPSAGSATDPFAPDPPVAAANRKDVDWSKLLNEQPTLAGTQETPVAVKPITAVSDNKKPAEPAVADITKPGPTPIQQLPVQGESSPSQQQANETKPQAAPAASDPPAIPPPVSTNNEVATTPPAAQPTSPSSTVTEVAPTTAAPQSVHVVETGETFSTIALKYYGNPNLYGALMRANPSIEPTKLRPGMKVTVPPASTVKPAAAAAAERVDASHAQVSTARIEQPLDASTQYRVQPGDSLYSIAKKLYGRFDKQDAIYAANKATIGEDMHRLKVGQVLTLPEPPTKKKPGNGFTPRSVRAGGKNPTRPAATRKRGRGLFVSRGAAREAPRDARRVTLVRNAPAWCATASRPPDRKAFTAAVARGTRRSGNTARPPRRSWASRSAAPGCGRCAACPGAS